MISLSAGGEMPTRHRASGLMRSILDVGVLLLLGIIPAPQLFAADYVCPADCNTDGVVTFAESANGLTDILTPHSSGSPSLCPAIDYNGDQSYGIEDLTRSRWARALGCEYVVAPAGLRGGVVNKATGSSIASATIKAWRLPVDNVLPLRGWPLYPTTPTPTPARSTSSSVAMASQGLPALNYAFDPPSASCGVGISSTPAPTPGWYRIRVSRSGYEPAVTYRYVGFSEPEKSFDTAACTTGDHRLADTQNFQLWPNTPPAGATPTPHPALPDLIVSTGFLEEELRSFVCVDMPNGAPWRDLAVVRVGVGAANVGEGNLELMADNLRDCTSANDNLRQRIFRSDGSTLELPLPPASILFHPSHLHFHLLGWAELRIINHDPSCSIATDRPADCVAANGDKISFCLQDSYEFDTELSNTSGKYYDDCIDGDQDGAITMGISRGWADAYFFTLPGLFVDITDVPLGSYWVEAEVNTGAGLIESTRNNNTGRAESLLNLSSSICSQSGANWQCTNTNNCETIDCRNIEPDCCTCPNGGSLNCTVCKEYFCHLDPDSPACLGKFGTCGPDCMFLGLSPVVCPPPAPTNTGTVSATFTPTATPTVSVTPTRTNTGTATVTGTRPTSTPTPILENLTFSFHGFGGTPGQTVSGISVSASGTQGRLAGAQFDFLLPNSVIAAPSSPTTGCAIASGLSATHTVVTSLPSDNPVSGFTRYRVLIAEKTVLSPTPSTASMNVFSDGVIASCAFSILSNASPGSYLMPLDRLRASDERGTYLHPRASQSGVIVADPNNCN